MVEVACPAAVVRMAAAAVALVRGAKDAVLGAVGEHRLVGAASISARPTVATEPELTEGTIFDIAVAVAVVAAVAVVVATAVPWWVPQQEAGAWSAPCRTHRPTMSRLPGVGSLDCSRT